MWHVWGTEEWRTGSWKERSEGKGPTGRPRTRWKDISMSLQHLEWGGMD